MCVIAEGIIAFHTDESSLTHRTLHRGLLTHSDHLIRLDCCTFSIMLFDYVGNLECIVAGYSNFNLLHLHLIPIKEFNFLRSKRSVINPLDFMKLEIFGNLSLIIKLMIVNKFTSTDK